MNIYLISQKVNTDWDTYDSAVVIANDEEEARHIHPSSLLFPNLSKREWSNDSWSKPEDVIVTLIGTATHYYNTPKVICASFNAG